MSERNDEFPDVFAAIEKVAKQCEVRTGLSELIWRPLVADLFYNGPYEWLYDQQADEPVIVEGHE